MLAIGIWEPVHSVNIGTLLRSAYALGANMVFTIGDKKYRDQPGDTEKVWKRIPFIAYPNFKAFSDARPHGAELVCIETGVGGGDLTEFVHPYNGIYLLGHESNGIPEWVCEEAQHVVEIDTQRCLNMAVAGSLVLYDRHLKTKCMVAPNGEW